MRVDYKNWMPKGMIYSFLGGAVGSCAVAIILSLLLKGTLRTVLTVVFTALALLFCGLPCAILLADVALGAIYCEMFFGRVVASNEFTQYVLIPISIGYKVLWVMFFLQILFFSFRGSR